MTRDWGGFGSIVNEARALDTEIKARPRVACPNCGTPLNRRSDGAVDCPMGDFTARGGE